MTKTHRWALSWNVLRAVIAVVITVAVLAQASVTIGGATDAGREVLTTTINFFSFFTILSNVAAAMVLVWASVWFFAVGRSGDPEPRGLALALASVSTYMIVTGVVYNTLLRSIELPQGTTVPWSNEVLHLVAPLFLLADVFLAPRRRPLRWRAILEILAFPIVWVIYTLTRGPFVTNPVTGDGWWYPYPFLDPHSATTGGYGGVAIYVIGISVAICAVAALVIWAGRRRGAHQLPPA
ncbi:Pr6Pr family membrane protein (plasmid) [Coraliomargarita sp. W4R53]